MNYRGENKRHREKEEKERKMETKKLHRHADVCRLVNRVLSCHISCIVLVALPTAQTEWKSK